MSKLEIMEIDGGVVLGVKVVPGSSRTVVAGVLDGMLKVKISAAPEKGKANKSLVDFLAKSLGVRRNDIEITFGQTKAVKQIRIAGVTGEQIESQLGL